MYKQLCFICLCLSFLLGCESKKPDTTTPPTDTTTAIQTEPVGSHTCPGPLTKIDNTNSDVLTIDAATDEYVKYKKRILKRGADFEAFCLPNSGSDYKILKCGHFPAGHIEDHLCISETSLRQFKATFDGIRLYPVMKGTSATDMKKVRFLLTFTKKKAGTADAYDDDPTAPVLKLKLDNLKSRICEIGEHKLAILMAHRLCTPRCPEGTDGDMLFDY